MLLHCQSLPLKKFIFLSSREPYIPSLFILVGIAGKIVAFRLNPEFANNVIDLDVYSDLIGI